MNSQIEVLNPKPVCPLVQYVEIWTVDEDQQSMRLQSHGRVRGEPAHPGSDGCRLKSGEGPAGMAWHQRRAVILQESPSDLLKRIGTKNGVTLSALIAFPVMRGQEVRAVVVLGIGSGPGAFEVWSRDDRDELSVSSGYYSGLKSFELISRYVRFPKGAGLPGAVWKTGDAKIAADLPNNARFMRSFGADEAELNTGLGLPIGSSAGHSESVLLLLSSHAKPIARVFEIWNPDSAPLNGVAHETLSHSAVADCWNSGLPVFRTDLASDHTAGLNTRCSEAGQTGLCTGLAIPLFRGTERTAVVVMLF